SGEFGVFGFVDPLRGRIARGGGRGSRAGNFEHRGESDEQYKSRERSDQLQREHGKRRSQSGSPPIEILTLFWDFVSLFSQQVRQDLRACPHTFPVSAKARGLGGWFEARPLVFGVPPVTIGASRWRNEGSIVALRKEMVRRRSLALGNTRCVPD